LSLTLAINLPEGEKQILGEWRFSDKGAGAKIFDFDIPG
jgi:hypothetical protein